MDYWEREFIRQGAERLKHEAYLVHLDTIRTTIGEQAYQAELLSEKPIKTPVVTKPFNSYRNTTKDDQ